MTASPSINYVYADKDSNIAHYYNAMMPKRPEGDKFLTIDWLGLVVGDPTDFIWKEYYPLIVCRALLILPLVSSTMPVTPLIVLRLVKVNQSPKSKTKDYESSMEYRLI